MGVILPLSERAPKTTKCLLVQPRFSRHSFWNYSEVARITGAKYPAAPLGLLTVAALLPPSWDVKLIDENVTPLTDETLRWADVVCTGGMLPQQMGVLGVMERAHAFGKAVVVGGPDPTSQPEIYKGADYLVLGEGEVTVPPFLEDFGRGVPGGVYAGGEKADMTRAAVPRFDLIKFSDYMHVGVQFSRGCPFNCEFCDVIELFGRRPRAKTSAHVRRELQALYDLGYRGHVDFVDDNLIGNRKEVAPVLADLREWQREHRYPFYFSTEASLNLARDDTLLGLMRDNDFRYVFIGIETSEEHVLAKTSKQLKANVSVAEAISKISSYGMVVNGGFIMGFDNEDERTAANMIACIQETGICMAMVGTLFALPNTQLTRRLEREGRLFADGVALEEGGGEIDQTSSGLNFVTSRPSLDILRDYVAVLEHIYAPRNYYARVARTGANVKLHAKHRPPFRTQLRLLWAFAKLCARFSMTPRVGYLFWLTVFRSSFRGPQSIATTVNLAAMYIHFAKQSRFIIRNIKRRMAELTAGKGRYASAASSAG